MKKLVFIVFVFILITSICKGQNIYNSNGTLTDNRLVSMGSNFLCFSNNGSSKAEDEYKTSVSGFSIRATTGGKFLNKGVGLEFALPANTDGSNFWSFARLITIPMTTNTQDATGKMILGTRRWFDKYGTGKQWYFGDDITIDGIGNIGIGALTPQAKLDVRGKIIADEVEVKVNKGADFVFKPDYNLKPLSEVEAFVRENQHLPEVPSEKEMQQNGLNVNNMQIKLLQKIEELTLYVIQQDKKITEQSDKIAELEKKIGK